ncbi:MAG: phage holin family protein [Rothia sp. (in: high G+C Gram-positive bacteria)]|nr:phage holin family protein [Rothia sp. (in: high G+C Gram-positive bacteria)]
MSVIPPPSDPEVRAEREPLGEMFKSLSTNLSTLIQQEIALAKAEILESTDQAKKSATIMSKGAGMLAGAGVAALFLLLFLSLALMWAFGTFMPLGWAAVIVALIWACVAVALAMVGKNHLDRGKSKLQQATNDPLARTRETAAEIPDTVNPTKETP